MDTRKVALITGCSTGIGRATALAFQEAGYITYATARRPETLQDLSRAGCQTLPLDVTDEHSMQAAVQQVVQTHGGVSVLVNNAGYGEYGPLEELAMEALRKQFETNVFGLLRMCQLVLPGMRAAGWGHIINVSSVGGEMALPVGGAYHASKYAVEALSDVLRAETKPFGIRVSVIQPGFVKTNFLSTQRDSDGMQHLTGPYAGIKTSLDRMGASVEGGSMGGTEPEAIARVIVAAAQARTPRTRYKISMVAHLLPMLRRWLPDRGWDALVNRMIPNQA
jgi:NAD(P)-dependent dehydrogenase (short-subunit alcohol dehydrogenase family)